MTTDFCRLAIRLPTPESLSQFEPFQPLGNDQYALRELEGDVKTTSQQLLTTLRKLMAQGETVGLSRIPRAAAVFFDMDATVIEQESIVEIAKTVGVEEEVQRLTTQAMAGDLPFPEALRQRVALLKDVEVETLEKVADGLKLNPGIQALAGFCREIGVPVFLVSGGFVPLAAVIQRRVGFSDVAANDFEVKDGRLTGKLAGDVFDADSKLSFAQQTCQQLGIELSQVAAVGDGANDLKLLQAVGTAVGYKPKPVLIPHLHAQVADGDHRFLAPLLFGRDVTQIRKVPR